MTGSTSNMGPHSRRRATRVRRGRSRSLLSCLATGLIVMGCSAGLQTVNRSQGLAPSETASDLAVQQAEVLTTDTGAIATAEPLDSGAIAAPQLVKTATLSLQVDEIETQIQIASDLVRQVNGDVLQLQDRAPLATAIARTAYLQLRVPQGQLDETLKQLEDLGTVTFRSLTAEDVSAQLVDFAARLRNLRKTEETTLAILDRSGEISDVLAVTQELSQIRESIEQISAQEQFLKTRVAFSTIELNLTESASAPLPKGAWQRSLTQAWQNSTRSLAQFSRGVVVLLVWLLVYSPYWLLAVVCLYLGYRGWRRWRRSKPGMLTGGAAPENNAVGEDATP